MKPALLLVDLQQDFLARPGLAPSAPVLVEEAARLLEGCRARGVPVFHARLRVRPDGSDRMPHWKRLGIWDGVAGRPGAEPPERLRPLAGELCFFKRAYDAFADPGLDPALRDRGIDTLIVAGCFLHACVRTTALAAYERGYRVWIAEDAVGSPEPDHAELVRIHLERAFLFLDTPTLLARLDPVSARAAPAAPRPDAVPVAHIAGRALAARGPAGRERRNPSRWDETLAWVPAAGDTEVEQAAAAAREAQAHWGRTPVRERRALLDAWAEALLTRGEALASLLALEIGKPLREARAEVARAAELVRSVARTIAGAGEGRLEGAPPVSVRVRPRGVVALVTPWNNPVLIPAGKIAPAVGLGNAAVWKPAVEAPRTALALIEALAAAGAPPGLVNLVFGEARIARALMAHPAIDAVSLTGSLATGRSAAARCAHFGKALQAELGGNNAAIVLADFDVAAHARALALAAFSFAGQRCTSIQRFIVERRVEDELRRALVTATESLGLGDPEKPETELGPLVSRTQRARIQAEIERAVAAGARLLAGGSVPEELAAGCWLRPALLDRVAPEAPLARQEVFGPVAVILPADDLDHALALANSVEHGLLAALCSESEAKRRRFAEAAEAGILQLAPGPLDVHPEAPFGGWKASGLGPPEHGRWDLEFYARPQAVYGESAAAERKPPDE